MFRYIYLLGFTHCVLWVWVVTMAGPIRTIGYYFPTGYKYLYCLCGKVLPFKNPYATKCCCWLTRIIMVPIYDMLLCNFYHYFIPYVVWWTCLIDVIFPFISFNIILALILSSRAIHLFLHVVAGWLLAIRFSRCRYMVLMGFLNYVDIIIFSYVVCVIILSLYFSAPLFPQAFHHEL